MVARSTAGWPIACPKLRIAGAPVQGALAKRIVSAGNLSQRGARPLDALARAKDARERVSPSQSQYEGWKTWLAGRGLEAPDFHTFGCIAYRHLARD